jgi:hypothetical protein
LQTNWNVVLDLQLARFAIKAGAKKISELHSIVAALFSKRVKMLAVKNSWSGQAEKGGGEIFKFI